MADVAVISVISSGVVGVLGAATGLYGQRLTFASERAKRHEARRDDLRNVLDEAAGGAIAFLGAISFDETATFGDQKRRVAELVPDLGRHAARIGVRVGTDAAVNTAYRHVLRAVMDVLRAIAALPAAMTLGEAAAQVQGNEDAPIAERYNAARTAVDEANGRIDAFLDSASRLVGL